MSSRDEPFQPESIEAQINQLEQVTPQFADSATPNARMVKDLRLLSSDYTQSGKRVWARLSERMAQQNEASNIVPILTREGFHTERSLHMHTDQLPKPQAQHTTQRRKHQRKRTLVASLLAAAVLVGMMVTIITLVHSHQSTITTAGKTATATPTPPQFGAVMYTRSPQTGTNESSVIAWSPDSKRVATVVSSPQGPQIEVQIWDATTGGHLVTVPLSGNIGANEIYWSPTGKYLLLSNLFIMAIVDSQTGSIVNTIKFDTTSFAHTSVVGPSLLSSRIPSSGGFGFYSAAWTPDGSSLAISLGTLSEGKVELINPLTGAVQTTFSAPAYRVGFSMAFSDDGHYLAVSYPNEDKIVVWNVSTRAVAFQQDSLQYETISWQPGTYHLAGAAFYPRVCYELEGH